MNCAINLFSDPSPLLVPTALLDGLVLTATPIDSVTETLDWVWLGAAANGWAVEGSSDGGVTWTNMGTYGPTNSVGADPFYFYRVYGIDGGGLNFTGYSNVVGPTAGVPANAFVDSAGNPFVDSAGNTFTT